ncbi:hypothetical protein TRM7557_03587 [Tritonibacter multivorans]|uniref:DUF2087 domain-containing protein n=1 Tax=Tritonibacter multivorans TaxID=928856 RepID=A0A0P1GY41_9RHOB|nr:DUF2087 domain-containing protein [Tritonibacter multivorans]MDA7420358.1 DUF2087 domain-containing protein [Tritonibacter multivorans]CUH81746.1 hypothetical protein TRM7557_03587 [Tritonibacter multivorans]SFC42852.1 hypothetical protein SAMN04488049_102424 [Tritonibacter multivorans]
MSRDVLRLTIDDLSQFTKTLRGALPAAPGQSEMLGHIARAAGYRNYQHLKSRLTPEPAADQKRVARALRYFAPDGRWENWPLKRGVRELCLWVIWSRLPARDVLTERQISAVIDEETVFRDPAQIRRSLVEMQLLTRNIDGSAYERLERPMPPDAQALLRAIKERAQTPKS